MVSNTITAITTTTCVFITIITILTYHHHTIHNNNAAIRAIPISQPHCVTLAAETQNQLDKLQCNSSFPSSPPQGITKWTQPALCHVSNNGKSVDCTLLAKRKGSKYFNFDENHLLWSPVTTDGCTYTRVWNYRYKCLWCPSPFTPHHQHPTTPCLTGRLLAGRFNDDHDAQSIDGRDMAMRRSFSSTAKPDAIVWMGIFLKCEMDHHPIPINEVGYFYMQAASLLVPRFFQLSVNRRIHVRGSEVGENVICGRAVYGDLHPEVLTRFTKFYTEAWEFNRVIVYEIGLSRIWWERDAHLAPLLASGTLIVVDIREALQELYGGMASDATLFSTGSAQLLVKADCVNRARIARAKWTLHVDFDEILVHGINAPPQERYRWKDVVKQPTINARKQQLRVVSFGSVFASDTTFCQCNEQFNYRDWIDEIREYHKKFEWQRPYRRRNESSWHGPFECTEPSEKDVSLCDGAAGRRKIALRLDQVAPQPFGLGVHEMSSCTYGPSDGDELIRTTNRLSGKVAYLRHYRCMNFAGFCHGDRTNKGHLPWFGPASPVGKRYVETV